MTTSTMFYLIITLQSAWGPQIMILFEDLTHKQCNTFLNAPIFKEYELSCFPMESNVIQFQI